MGSIHVRSLLIPRPFVDAQWGNLQLRPQACQGADGISTAFRTCLWADAESLFQLTSISCGIGGVLATCMYQRHVQLSAGRQLSGRRG